MEPMSDGIFCGSWFFSFPDFCNGLAEAWDGSEYSKDDSWLQYGMSKSLSARGGTLPYRAFL